ncbi:MAG: hypothetical protein ACYCV4_01030 [Dermatophilaceae bacterium]
MVRAEATVKPPPAIEEHPAGHPAHVYLNESRLNEAVLPFLADALFGPERVDYWHSCPNIATEAEQAAPAAEPEQAALPPSTTPSATPSATPRSPTWNATSLNRQLLNLEADDVTPALRRRVALRVASQPTEHAIDVTLTLTLYDCERSDAAAQGRAEDWSVHPAPHNATLSPRRAGKIIVLPHTHAKVRRGGYPKMS